MVENQYDSEASDGTSGSSSDGGNRRRTPATTTTTTPTTWQGWKERGRQAYIQRDYATALQAYSQALHRGQAGASRRPPKLDQQLLLSNTIACRLRIGGAAQAEAAVAAAKKCIALNENWAKGHVRLAEAYIALGRNGSNGGGGNNNNNNNNNNGATNYSNEACNSLQRALRIDPGNATARTMLMRELRSRDQGPGASGSAEPSAPPQHMDNNNNTNENNNTNNDYQDIDHDHGNTLSWGDRIRLRMDRARMWYSGQEEDVQTFLKLLGLFLLLYVAFGGFFGLEYYKNRNQYTPRSNSVYEEFYRTRNQQHHGHHRQQEQTCHAYDSSGTCRSGFDSSDSGTGQSSSNSRSGNHQSESTWSNSGRPGTSWWNYGFEENVWFPTSPDYWKNMMLVSFVTVVIQQCLGIRPFQLEFVMNMLGMQPLQNHGAGMFGAEGLGGNAFGPGFGWGWNAFGPGFGFGQGFGWGGNAFGPGFGFGQGFGPGFGFGFGGNFGANAGRNDRRRRQRQRAGGMRG